MRSVREFKDNEGMWDHGKLLTAAMLTRAELSITVKVRAVVKTPDEWKNRLALVIEETKGCGSISLNRTNIGLLAELIDDDMDRWAGYEVTFAKVDTFNPSQNNAPCKGLEVESVKAPRETEASEKRGRKAAK